MLAFIILSSPLNLVILTWQIRNLKTLVHENVINSSKINLDKSWKRVKHCMWVQLYTLEPPFKLYPLSPYIQVTPNVSTSVPIPFWCKTYYRVLHRFIVLSSLNTAGQTFSSFVTSPLMVLKTWHPWKADWSVPRPLGFRIHPIGPLWLFLFVIQFVWPFSSNPELNFFYTTVFGKGAP